MLLKHSTIFNAHKTLIHYYSYSYVYYFTEIRPAVVNEIEKGDQIGTESIITNNNGEIVYKKTTHFVAFQDGPWTQ